MPTTQHSTPNFNLMFTLLLLGILSAPGLPGQQVVLQEGLNGYAGTNDGSLYKDRVDNSNGGFPLIFSGTTVNSVRRGLLRFDFTSVTLPPEPYSVTLTIVLDRSGLEAGQPDVYGLHRITTAWGEGTTATVDINTGGLGVAANAGDATWNSAFHGSNLWATPGGDYVSTPSSTQPINRWDDVRPENNIYTFTGAGLANDVALWAANPAQNHGWMLLGNELVARNARRFWASESADASLRPMLTITSTSPVADWYLY